MQISIQATAILSLISGNAIVWLPRLLSTMVNIYTASSKFFAIFVVYERIKENQRNFTAYKGERNFTA